MAIPLPKSAADAFSRGEHYNLDNSAILAYGLQGVASKQVQEICDRATESYAKQVLNWPNGQLAKPDIFIPASESSPENVAQCAERFVQHLNGLYPLEKGRELRTYPHAFVVICKGKLPDTVLVVIAYQENETWCLKQRSVPIDVELGLSLDSLRFGDITEEDILNKFKNDETEEVHERDQKPQT